VVEVGVDDERERELIRLSEDPSVLWLPSLVV
jgi:hypothetical protein